MTARAARASRSAGLIRRNERGPIVQRAALLVIARMPRSRAISLHSVSSSWRHGCCWHAVQASVSERTRSGWRRARIWAITPPIDAPTMWASSAPAWSMHGDRVVDHLHQRVGAVRLVAAAGAAVVEGDRAIATGERQALQDPQVLVGAEALDHHHRRRAAAAGRAVVDADAVGGAHVGHQPNAPRSTPAPGNQSISVPVSGPPNSMSSSSIRRWRASASSSSASGPRRMRVRRHRRPRARLGRRGSGVPRA